MCSGCDANVAAAVCGLCDGNADALAMCSEVGAPVCDTVAGDAVGGTEERLSTDTPSAEACALLVAQNRAIATGMYGNFRQYLGPFCTRFAALLCHPTRAV